MINHQNRSRKIEKPAAASKAAAAVSKASSEIEKLAKAAGITSEEYAGALAATKAFHAKKILALRAREAAKAKARIQERNKPCL